MDELLSHIPNDKKWLAENLIVDFGKQKSLNLFCKDPFDGCSIDRFGQVFVCTCDGKLPISVGHITDFQSLEEVWINDIARQLQQSILEKKFTYCDVNNCGILHNNSSNADSYFSSSRRKEIFLNIDESCNLQCPSCRDTMIYIKNGKEYTDKKAWMNHFHDMLKQYNGALDLYTSGNGDPLASEICHEFLLTCELKNNQKFNFLTNGLLLRQRFSENPYLVNNTNLIMISIDAGSKEVYEDVRRPGKWEKLIDNLDCLHTLSKQGIAAQLNFVIQRANYRDIPNFINLAEKYEFRTHYALLEDWRTLDGGFYQKNAVHNESHPEYQNWLNIYDTFKDKINLAR
jgi:MoaA/NifB/PqqE/SkfB family radical SAM enzyme